MRDAILEIVRLKKRLLIAVGLLALLALALLIAVDGYQRPGIIAAQMKWSDLRRQVVVAGHADVTNAYKQGKADLATLRGRIPPKRQFPRLLGDILEQAVSCGVSR